LLLLADPASVSILRQLVSGPLENSDLFDRVEHVSRSTYFDRMRDLEALSLISRNRQADVPPVAECRLTDSGVRLLPVADLLEAWLAGSPQGPLRLAHAYATTVIKTLAVAGGSTLLRCLAERPHSLHELAELVHGLSYRKLERTARNLVKTGLAERVAVRGRLSHYKVTPWARRAAGPLAAAIRWERYEIPEQSALVTSVETEGGLLLALPLIEVSADSSGACALLVDADAPAAESLGGALVRLIDGRPISWAAATGPRQLKADAWARGTAIAWLDAVSDTSSSSLQLSGDTALAEKVVGGLRKAASVPSVPVGQSFDSAGRP
jgi:DNA-binding HxlR family transcriptional regulator